MDRDDDDDEPQTPSGAPPTLTVPGSPAREPGPLPPAPDHRYQVLDRIGHGATAEVYRVVDLDMNRILAMKVIRPSLVPDPEAVARFNREASTLGRLLHPHIVPVMARGTFADGRAWFTMGAPEGPPLTKRIDALHEAGDLTSQPVRRMVREFRMACRGVAHAHRQGVVHRDLKPENIICGPGDGVYVIDWGLAGPAGMGIDRLQLAGTPAFMAPEQAEGAWDRVGPPSDVYALGATLFNILLGEHPFRGRTTRQTVDGLIRRERLKLDALRWRCQSLDLGEDLVAIVAKATAPHIEDRQPNAEAFADELTAWLEGARRHSEGLRLVARSDRHAQAGAALDQEAKALAERGHTLLERIPGWAHESEKQEAWRLLDASGDADRSAREARSHALRDLHSALQLDPHLPAAHAILANHARRHHEIAEQARDAEGAALQEGLLRHHTEALPPGHAARVSGQAYLSGVGTLSLVTDPPGTEVLLYRYVRRGRRLHQVFERHLGQTPLHHVSLSMGSYLCVLRHPDHRETRYPVNITRQHSWDGVAPHESGPTAIKLPPRGSVGAGACYVPAGWYRSGALGRKGLPVRRRWCHGFLLQRFPVTNRDYIAFLDDLIRQGRSDEAWVHVPRERSSRPDRLGAPLYGLNQQGRFELVTDSDGDRWSLDWPVVHVVWSSARAYARWVRDRTGEPWRLPGELEWEKAARGVDGRSFPWGDHFDPSWCRMRDSARGRAHGDFGPSVVCSYPVDTSPYGVRGMAGNVRDWILDCPDLTDSPQVAQPAPASGDQRFVRGGAWGFGETSLPVSLRGTVSPRQRDPYIGIRLARPFP